MRFQAKLQKEQEQKRNEMNSPGGLYRSTTTSTSSSTTTTTGNGVAGGGKVRQLFEERRQRGVGIDKSYPLQPISTSSINKRHTLGTTSMTTTTTQKPLVSRPMPRGNLTTTSRTSTSSLKFGSSADTNNNFEAPTPPRVSGLNGKLAGLSLSSEINNNNNNGAIKLKPVSLASSNSSAASTRTINGRASPVSVVDAAPVRAAATKPAAVVRTTTPVKTVANNKVTSSAGVATATPPPRVSGRECGWAVYRKWGEESLMKFLSFF